LRLLLDTHVFLWWATNPAQLPPRMRHEIAVATEEVHVSVASLWEIAIKVGNRRLEFPLAEAEALIVEHGLLLLPIAARHVLAVAGLPPIHRDPFDRLIVAQAAAEGLRACLRIGDGRDEASASRMRGGAAEAMPSHRRADPTWQPAAEASPAARGIRPPAASAPPADAIRHRPVAPPVGSDELPASRPSPILKQALTLATEDETMRRYPVSCL